MGGLPEIQKLAGTCFGSDLFGGNASWNFLFYKWKLGFSVWRKETDPDLSRMLYRILYYLWYGNHLFLEDSWDGVFPKGLRAYPGQRGRSNVVPPGKDIYDHWMDTVYPGISPRFDPGRWISQLDVFLGAMPLDNHHPWVLTMIMGGLLTLGKTIWCYNFGCVLIIIVFTFCGNLVLQCGSPLSVQMEGSKMDTFWYCSAVCICSHIWKLCAGSDQRWIIYGSHYFVFCSVYRYLSFRFPRERQYIYFFWESVFVLPEIMAFI